MKSLTTIVAGAAILGAAACGIDAGQSPTPDPAPAVAHGTVRARDIAQANRQLDVDMNLIARVYIDEFLMAEFYEPSPGQLVFSTAGRPKPGTKSLRAGDVKEMSATEIFQKIAPGIAVPAVIARLDARARGAEVIAGSPGGTATEGKTSPTIEEKRGANAVEISLEAPHPTGGTVSDIGTLQSAAVDPYCEAFFPEDHPCPTGGVATLCGTSQSSNGLAQMQVNSAYFAICPFDAPVNLTISVSAVPGYDVTGIYGAGFFGAPIDTFRDFHVGFGPITCYPSGCVPKIFNGGGWAQSEGRFQFQAMFDRSWWQ
jgi:hypothetical protein